MDFHEAMHLVEADGFLWGRFRDIFPFGDAYLREGNYSRLITCILDRLDSDSGRELLLDLIDTQHSVFLEQVGHLRIQSGDVSGEMFEMEAHLLSAQLEINSQLRNAYGLKSKNAGEMMYRLNFPEERLLNRMMLSKEDSR